MMGQQVVEMDIESQKSSRRGRCLDVFFTVSIIFLFVAVTAVVVGGAMFVVEQQRKHESSLQSIEVGTFNHQTATASPGYKMHNFVHLEAGSSNLLTSNMLWRSVPHGAHTSVGSNYEFNKDQSSLKPKQHGSYFIYLALNFTCTFNCTAGFVSVNVGNKLTCKVQLPAVTDSEPVSKKCWTVSQFNSQPLHTWMTVPERGLQNWKLELNSELGMFLVD